MVMYISLTTLHMTFYYLYMYYLLVLVFNHVTLKCHLACCQGNVPGVIQKKKKNSIRVYLNPTK